MSTEPQAELVDEHPTVDDARTAARTDQPYRGVWWTPPQLSGRVHLFADPGVYPDAMLLDTGWTRHEEPVTVALTTVTPADTAASRAIADGPTRDGVTVELEGDA